jgi:NADP-dependent 3-hydroxy acid dehydrogenase YdfG
MSKTIIIVGFGPGVSTAVAERFGAEGFSVALIARSQARLTAGVEALKAKGVTSAGFPADASDPVAIRSAIAKARAEFGRVGVIHWNAYSGHGLGDLLAVDPASVKNVFDVAIVGLLSAVQEALPDLREARDGAVLVTNGAFGDLNPVVEAADRRFDGGRSSPRKTAQRHRPFVPAIAEANDCAVVTDNAKHFDGVQTINPIPSAI